jgi:hypothetical protein
MWHCWWTPASYGPRRPYHTNRTPHPSRTVEHSDRYAEDAPWRLPSPSKEEDTGTGLLKPNDLATRTLTPKMCYHPSEPNTLQCEYLCWSETPPIAFTKVLVPSRLDRSLGKFPPTGFFVVIPFYLQSVLVHTANCVKTCIQWHAEECSVAFLCNW